jgi:hypothetical protein
MSLRYIDCFLHCLPNFTQKNDFMMETPWEKALYEKVRFCGLDKAITRIAIVCNSKGKFSINELQTSQEKLEFSHVSKSLKNVLVDLYHEKT